MTTLARIPARNRVDGFTLVELAIVLLIVALLLGGLLPTISSQVDQRHVTETTKQLDEIKDALIGFAVINGRLPCPAAPNATGVESPANTGLCTNPYDGFLPASTLGLSGTDSAGYATDAWGNRIRYAVTTWSTNSFTKPNGISGAGISTLAPDLQVCSTATGISATACAASAALTPNGVPAVIFSTGKNGGAGAAGIDETANIDGNQTFVSHLPAPSAATNGEFDDIVTWIPTSVLVNRMVAAGKLP